MTCHPHHELARYGVKRLKRIVGYVKNGGPGYETLFGGMVWRLEFRSYLTKQQIMDRICSCGIFQYVETKFGASWERLITAIALDKGALEGFYNLLGMNDPFKTIEEGMRILQRVTNKLSNIYEFPNDPPHPVSRKKTNDLRLNAIFKKNIFGQEPINIARQISSFKEVVQDPFIRLIFWSCYTPGTGTFTISVSNLDQLIDLEDCCPICLEGFVQGYSGIRLHPCKHVFHPVCIQNLILRAMDNRITCPICRTEVTNLG